MRHSQTLRAKYEADMSRLDAEYVVLDVRWRRISRSVVWALLALPLWWVFGWGAAVVELLVACALTATRAYLLAVRKSDNRWTRESLERELREQAHGPRVAGQRSFGSLHVST